MVGPLDITGQISINDTGCRLSEISGKDAVLYHNELLQLGYKFQYDKTWCKYIDYIKNPDNDSDPIDFLQMLARFRNPKLYNLYIVQKNTEELEKLQYQISPGKHFMDLMREEFPEISLFDIVKSNFL